MNDDYEYDQDQDIENQDANEVQLPGEDFQEEAFEIEEVEVADEPQDVAAETEVQGEDDNLDFENDLNDEELADDSVDSSLFV